MKGCWDKNSVVSQKQKTVMQVGQFLITQQMINDRDKIIGISYPFQKESLGLLQLQKAYTDAQVLINNGHKINDDVLFGEMKRIEENTLAPDKLQEIKDIFSQRKEAFLKTYILPIYAQRVIFFDFFLNDPKIQNESRQKADNFLRQAKAKPQDWDQLIKSMGLKSIQAEVSAIDGFQFVKETDESADDRPGLVDKSPQSEQQAQMKAKFEQRKQKTANQAGEKWIDEMINPTPPGSVIRQVINIGEVGWLVAYYIGPHPKKSGTHNLKVAIIPKRNFSKWHENEVKKVF